MSTIETSCRCGAVHLTTQGEPAVQLYCLAVIAVFGTWAWRDQRR